MPFWLGCVIVIVACVVVWVAFVLLTLWAIRALGGHGRASLIVIPAGAIGGTALMALPLLLFGTQGNQNWPAPLVFGAFIGPIIGVMQLVNSPAPANPPKPRGSELPEHALTLLSESPRQPPDAITDPKDRVH
jgi:hypothetical protein